MYYAIIGECVMKSKNDESLKILKLEIQQALQTLNQEYTKEIALDFELQEDLSITVLLKKATFILEMIDKIRYSIGLEVFRFGVGIDHENKKNTMSGNASEYAKEALYALKREEKKHLVYLLIKGSLNEDILSAFNSNLRLCDYIEGKWRDTQLELMKNVVLEKGYCSSIADLHLETSIGINSQAMAQRIRSSGYDQYIEAKKETSLALQAVAENQS